MEGLVLSLQEWLDLHDALAIAADESPLPHIEMRYRNLMDVVDEYIQSEFGND